MNADRNTCEKSCAVTASTTPVAALPTEPATVEPTEPATVEPTEPATTEPTEPATTEPVPVQQPEEPSYPVPSSVLSDCSEDATSALRAYARVVRSGYWKEL